MASEYRQYTKGVMGSLRPDRSEHVAFLEREFARNNSAPPEDTEELDVKLEEPTVCVYFPDHTDLTPEAFKFHLYACSFKYANQLHRFKLPMVTTQCAYCLERFMPPENEYHFKRCEKRKQAIRDKRLADLLAKTEIKDERSGGAGSSNPIAKDEDWDAEDVIPRNMTGGPICAYNPFKKVDKSPVIVIPQGKTRSERRRLIEKRAELFVKKGQDEDDGWSQ